MYRTAFAATLVVVIQANQLTTQVEDLVIDQLNFAQRRIANGDAEEDSCRRDEIWDPEYGCIPEGELAQVASNVENHSDDTASEYLYSDVEGGLAQVASDVFAHSDDTASTYLYSDVEGGLAQVAANLEVGSDSPNMNSVDTGSEYMESEVDESDEEDERANGLA